jgi:hypothetical protein
MDQDRLVQSLDQCLLTDAEFAQGPEGWASFDDPFPVIELELDEDESTELSHE